MAFFRCGGGSAKYKEDDHTFTATAQTHDVVCDFDVKFVVVVVEYTNANNYGFPTYFWDVIQTAAHIFWYRPNGTSSWGTTTAASNTFSLPNSKTLRVTAANANWVYPIKIYCFG